MISKELLNAVLGDKYNVERLCEWYEIEDGYLKTHYDCGKYDLQGRPTGLGIEINIHELAHLCKEWAYSTYGIMIQSYPYCGKGRADAIKGLKVDEVFKEKTEPEAIFKAAQWVLDNTSTNKLKGH